MNKFLVSDKYVDYKEEIIQLTEPHLETMKVLEKADSLAYVYKYLPDCVNEMPDIH